MDYNAQNKKIEAITERTLVIGIDVVVKRIMPEPLITEELSIPRNHLSLVMTRTALHHSTHGYLNTKNNMRRIR